MPALMPTSCSMHLTQHTLAPLSLRFAPTLFPLFEFTHYYLDSYSFFFLHQDFVTALSILLRGSITEKLQWTFNLYDINRDGYINKEVFLNQRSLVFLKLTTPFHLCFQKKNIGMCFICLTGNDRYCKSDIWYDGEVHIPCLENWCTQAACGCLLSGTLLQTVIDFMNKIKWLHQYW